MGWRRRVAPSHHYRETDLVQDEGGGLNVLLYGGQHEDLAEHLTAEYQRLHLRQQAHLSPMDVKSSLSDQLEHDAGRTKRRRHGERSCMYTTMSDRVIRYGTVSSRK